MAFHRLGQTRQVIQWSQITETLGDCVLVPIPPAVLHVACKLLAERGIWPSTFAIDIPTSIGYNSPDVESAEWLNYKSELASFLTDGMEFMTKFTDLIAQQAKIEDAIRDLQEYFRVSGCASGAPGTTKESGAIYPVDYPGYIDPKLSPGGVAQGKCESSNWMWEQFELFCNELDELTEVGLASMPFSDLILEVGGRLSMVMKQLDGPALFLLRAIPPYAMVEVLSELDDNEVDTKAALMNAYEASTVRQAFSWLNETIGGSSVEFIVNFAINALAAIGLDSSRWFSLPEYDRCGGSTAELGSVIYTGPTIPPVLPIYGVLMDGPVGSCSSTRRYTVAGEAGCQITMNILGNLYGKTTITMKYAFYESDGVGTVVIRDGELSIGSGVVGCDCELVFTNPSGLNNPQVTVGCTSANGADFWPSSIGLS